MDILSIDFDSVFTEKYKLYGEMLFKIAFLYTKNSADAEDILQDVFTKFFCLKKEFNSPDHEKAWLIRVTQNKSIDFTRKRKRSLYELIDDVSDTENIGHLQTELQQDLTEKILKLDNKYKTVILLYYYYDYSVCEIAKTLKISTDAVKKRLQRSREQLKLEMEDYNK